MKIKKLLVIILLLLLLCGCGADTADTSEPAASPAAETGETLPFATFTFTHYSSGGTREEYTAIILFEQSNSTFTSYQVAYSSCTCRDSSVNYYSVCYVELLNNKDTPEDAAIRTITFGDNKGLWGDSNPNYYISEYTQEYMDEHLVQSFVHATKADVDAWGGYGTQIDCVDADAVTGATVSSSNLTSMLQGLFEYHTEHYYN